MNTKTFFVVLTALVGALLSVQGQAQAIYTEDFTGAATTNSWYFFNGACLTAGSSSGTTSPGTVPGCATVWSNYYQHAQNSDPYLVGGNSGYLGTSTAPSSGSAQTPDPVGSGALRFTNGYPYGHQERGAIVSGSTFSTSAGIQVTFKTITYLGDSGGTGKDGADGMSFFLMDGSITPTAIGATGGSLGYSCTNETGNVPYDGLTSGYIGLGIDEYGNFLNGATLVSGYTGSNKVSGTNGDNTSSGYGYKPNRIGMRGAGSISWAALTTAYGTYQGSSLPYYPASLATTYGTYNGSTASAYSCVSGTNSNDEFCWACPSAATFPGAPTNATGTVTGTATTCTDVVYNSVSTCPAATLNTAYSGAPSTPTGTITFNGTNCIDTLYSTVGSCPAATSYASYSGAPSSPTGAVTLSGGKCIDTLYSTAASCPAATSYASYSGAPSTPTGTITVAGGYCVDTVSYNALATCPAASSYAFYGAPSSGGTISFSASRCKDKVGTTTYTGPATAAYNGPATVAYTGPSTAAYTGPGTATFTTTPTYTAVTATGGSGTTLAQQAVQQACITGNLYNYYDPAAPALVTSATLNNTSNPANILDYAPIPNAYTELSGFTIGNEGATTRAAAVAGGAAIFYNLKITQDGKLSLSYSQNGGAYSYVIKNQLITASNGPLPSTFRFGFSGSTGGDTNIHEIMCFKAASANTSGSSATVNEKQAAKVEAGTQAYFAFYNPNDWTGSLTANNLNDVGGVVSVASPANWDASCVLSGTPAGTVANGFGCAETGVSGPTSPAPAWQNRVMLTWDTSKSVGGGIPFEWPGTSSGVNSAQQAVLDDENNTPDGTAATAYRLNYLRGDTSNETTSTGTGLFRARDSLLGDIVDSSPTWVGPPSSPYTQTWVDRTQPGTTMPENTSTYLQYVAAAQTRLNVVYAGANDGFLHGFEAGSFDSGGNFCGTSSSTITCGATPNDGLEVLAYMPGSTLVSPALSTTVGGCAVTTTTGTIVQNIHGWTPAIGTGGTQCENAQLDYSGLQYGHNFFVDATPGEGDLYYNNAWHTWLVGGLGAGGAAIYALDVTNPANFSQGNASTLVMGEWNSSSGLPSSITCLGATTGCNVDMGNTFGTPQIRRLHNGNWGVIFGNGFGSVSGDAGIYVMLVSSTGTETFYYLSTGTGTGTATTPCTSGCNGIGYTTPADLDGDHITDYVYAGDLKGNVWRFDLTAANPALWGVTNAAGVSVNAPVTAPTPTTGVFYGADANGNGGGTAAPLFTAQSGQPITTQLLVISNVVTGGAARLLIEFGTGQRTQITNAAPASYVPGTQSLYGVWDWNLSAWNAMSGSQYANLTTSPNTTGLTSSTYTLGSGNLQSQTLKITSGTAGTTSEVVDETSTNNICWQGSTSCTSGNNQFGWYANLPSTNEQVIFNPVFFQGAFLVNTTVPATNVPTACTTNQDTGFTYALNIANGGVFTSAFPTFANKNGTIVSDATTAAVETNATGSVYVVQTVEGKANIVYQTVSGVPGAQQVNIPSNTLSKRLTWVELR